MFLLGATTRRYLRTAHRIAIRSVPLCPPHVLRNRAGESALDAVFEVGDTNAGERSSYGTDRLIFRSSQPAEVLERARAVLQVVLDRGRYGLVTLELAVL